ncbi:transposase [Cucumis melo var. makuwa]|uniref:Transposase n=2 Tax=Cucumis melo TaxID=3656 RepID=A0A5D3BL24_CUCMM|nr:transposase [Cucumis melo var. makuwa]
MYEAKKTLGALGMSYEKIDACPNDCCLYRKEHANATECPECGESRWKYANNANGGKNRFLEKLYDLKWPDFGSEPRNIRLALSADGINPHGEMSSKYSCWPAVIVIYNLPPWLCMKRKFMMLSMLISDPRQPGDDVGTYLAPLIEDLKLLWESGVEWLDASLDNSSFGRPLYAGVSFKLEQDLLYQAHRMRNVEISDNLRWIAHGPHPFVIKYNSYAINGYHYHTKSYDKNRSVQNSGVSLVAKTMQVSSSKDKNPIIRDMSFYGVIQDIWELNYNTFNVAVFRCDWVENNNGMKIDDLGFVLVDLKRIGHKSDSFIMTTQPRQVFYVEDPSDARWSFVFTPPQRDCEDQSNDHELGDIMLHCQGVSSDMPNIDGGNNLDENMIFSLHMEPTIVRDDQDKEVGRVEIDGLVVGVVDEHVEKRKQQRKQGPTIMFDVTRVRSEDVPAELKEKIYTIVEAAFIIDSRSRKSILKTEPELLKRPPYMYSYIDQKQWEEFVRSRLCPHFEDKRKLQQERRKKNKYNHRLSRKGYANIREELKNIPSEESELDRASMWKKARADKKRQCDNKDVQEVMNRIDEIFKTCADKKPSPNDVLTQALGTLESSGRVRGVGGFVTPSTYFHTAKRSKKRNEEIDKLSEKNEKLCLRVQELENIHISTQSTPTSAHGSCS